MKILIVSDHESKALWDFYEPGKLDPYDLIISCGDLAPQYLSFLATFTKAPVLYVHGNHDDCYEQTPPEGCTCIDGRMYHFRGLRIVGLGGSMRYRPGINQYTDREMASRARALRYRIWRNGGFDLLVTHSPAKGLGDCEDLTHTGFDAFVKLLDRYHPAYHIHGHVHANYSYKKKGPIQYGPTTILNVYESFVLEIPDPPKPQKKHRRARRKKEQETPDVSQ
ncbi:MAG: metallophosphoesterase family protein [Lachnospiraceae bacterium]|nr:metallophosphoesterase family protein [Lachnospiraceae bacterium]